MFLCFRPALKPNRKTTETQLFAILDKPKPDRLLAAYWQVFPNVREALFAPADRPCYSQPKVETSRIKAAIFAHPEFTAFNQTVTALFGTWKAANTPLLTGIKQGGCPKLLIEKLAENLLATFRSSEAIASLIDPYAIYQHLMDYWAETMQDDAWMIASDGWVATGNGRNNTDLIPPALIVARYYAAEQATIEQREAKRDAFSRQMEEMDEEHGGDEGLLNDARNDKGKLTAKSVKDRLKAIKGDKEAADERKLLDAYAALIEQGAAASKAVKDAQKALDTQVAARYAKLTEAEIKTLVLEDKWLAALSAQVQGELDRVSQTLTGRIRQLLERYATPLPRLNEAIETLAARVDAHLKKMGFAWL